jgi:hypothetical protein
MTVAGSRSVIIVLLILVSDTSKALGPVTTANVLDYFSYSIFWDPMSTNNQLRMQTMFSDPTQVNISDRMKYVVEVVVPQSLSYASKGVYWYGVHGHPCGASYLLHHPKGRATFPKARFGNYVPDVSSLTPTMLPQ